jgi:type II secretory pathway pseudopilin PulG
MRRSRSTAGYTLLELTIAVLIMGSMAAMIAPGLSEQMADTRASAAAEEMVRLSRMVRARVNQTGLAHLMRFVSTNTEDGSYGLGRVEIWEGMNNKCNHTPWKQTIDGDPDDGHQMVDGVDIGSSTYNISKGDEPPTAEDTGRMVVRMTASSSANGVNLCFEPGGMTLVATVEATAGDISYRFVPQTTAETFRVTRYIREAGGTTRQLGVERQIVFPPGGGGRLRF